MPAVQQHLRWLRGTGAERAAYSTDSLVAPAWWFDEDDAEQPLYWNGSAWVAVGKASAISGTAGRVAMFGAGGDTVVDSFLVGPAAHLLTLSAGGAYTLTVPESLTVAGRDVANIFTQAQTINGSVDVVQLTVRGAAGQNELLQAWQLVAGTVRAGVTSIGQIFAGGYADGLKALTATANSTVINPITNIGARENLGLCSWNINATIGSYALIDLRAGTADFRIIAINRGVNTGELAWYLDNGGLRQVLRIFSNGNVNIGAALADGGALHNVIGKSDIVQQVVRAHSTQIANLQEWQSFAGAALAYISPTGGASFAGVVTVGDGANYTEIKADGEINLHGTARVYETNTINFNHTIVRANGKPTVVTLGAHSGFSLPVFAADDEELYACKSLPLDMDTTADLVVYVGCYLDTANNAKKFKLQVSWSIDDLAGNDVLSSGTTDVETETTTGNAAQYTSYKVGFTLASVAAGAVGGNKIAIRLRRVAASADEITGEVVVCGMANKRVADKLGTAL